LPIYRATSYSEGGGGENRISLRNFYWTNDVSREPLYSLSIIIIIIITIIIIKLTIIVGINFDNFYTLNKVNIS
jgi:hypothetical protein